MGKKLIIAILIVGLSIVVRKRYYPSPVVKSPVVEVANGKLQGRISKSRDDRDFFEFLGLPYAKPPVGELRYEPPVPLVKKWDGVRDATQLGSPCIQVDGFTKAISGTEDCLFVNVHTPKLGDSKLPVAVFIHGGLFQFGSGGDYRPEYFMDEDVVIVTVNYRLASFGFLNTGNGLVRGNMGLKDQSLALRWVKENIKAFGGNPNDVTIFGESAGGASVHLQMLSPMSSGLFHKALCQSGLATMPWAVYPHPAKQAKRFAGQVNCPVDNVNEMVKCLKKKDASDLVQAHTETTDHLRPLISVFVPTLEENIPDGKTFISEDPKTLLEAGKFAKVPFVAGVNNGEGLLIAAPVIANNTLMRQLKSTWSETLPILIFLPEGTKASATEKMKKHYISEELDVENPMKHMTEITKLLS